MPHDAQPSVADLTTLVHQQQTELAELRVAVGRVQRAHRPMWCSPVALLAIVLLPLALGGVAMAAIPSANGVLTGCYDARTGALRIVDAETGKTCTAKELQVTWNQTGPQGLQGIQGPKGDPGAQGIQGIQGPAGISGHEKVVAESEYNATDHKVKGVLCPPGKRVLGGGGTAFVNGTDPNRDRAPLVIRRNEPETLNTWIVAVDEIAPYDQDWKVVVYAICANVEP